MNPSGPVLSVLEGNYWFNVSLLIAINVFKLSIFSPVSFGRLHPSKELAYFTVYQICGHRVVHSINLLSFNVHGSVVMSPLFISGVRNCCFLFHLSLARGLSVLLILSRNQLLVPLMLSTALVPLISALILIVSFLCFLWLEFLAFF